MLKEEPGEREPLKCQEGHIQHPIESGAGDGAMDQRNHREDGHRDTHTCLHFRGCFALYTVCSFR